MSDVSLNVGSFSSLMLAIPKLSHDILFLYNEDNKDAGIFKIYKLLESWYKIYFCVFLNIALFLDYTPKRVEVFYCLKICHGAGTGY